MKCSSNRCVDALICDSNSECSSGWECKSGRCTDPNLASRNMGCDTTAVYFEFNKSRLTGEARDGLQSNADCIKTKSGVITIEGHCDERGTEEYNLALGDRRARAVRDYMISLGVPRSKLRIVSKGELEPIDSGSSENAWAKNRRAEFE